jgi:hypothetical protein
LQIEEELTKAYIVSRLGDVRESSGGRHCECERSDDDNVDIVKVVQRLKDGERRRREESDEEKRG